MRSGGPGAVLEAAWLARLQGLMDRGKDACRVLRWKVLRHDRERNRRCCSRGCRGSLELGRPRHSMVIAGPTTTRRPGPHRARIETTEGRGKAAPCSETRLSADSPWSCVSGTFTSTVRRFSLICSGGSRQRATAFRRRARAHANSSFRSKRVGLAWHSLPCPRPAQALWGDLTPNHLLLVPSGGGYSRAPRAVGVRV